MKMLSRRYIWMFAFIVIIQVQPAGADYKQAVAFYNQKQYEKAIQELKPDIDKNPDWEFGQRLLGLCYLNLKNNALAHLALSRAADLKSKAFSTYFGLGQANCNMQKYDPCISALNRAESLASAEKDSDKELPKLYKFRGAAYYQTGKFSDAADDLIKALRVNQSDWSDYFMLGFSYFKLDRIEESIPALEKALAMKSGESSITDVLGKAYFKKGIASLSGKQYAAASQALLKAKDCNPQNGYIFYNLAEAYLFQKKYPEAEQALNQALVLIPRSPDVYGRMGFVYEKQKKWDLALNAYQKADEINPSKFAKEAIARVTQNKKR
jgi:tetratricopeptide (TPR) repeat protein